MLAHFTPDTGAEGDKAAIPARLGRPESRIPPLCGIGRPNRHRFARRGHSDSL